MAGAGPVLAAVGSRGAVGGAGRGGGRGRVVEHRHEALVNRAPRLPPFLEQEEDDGVPRYIDL